MGKSVHNDVLDASLNYLKENTDKIVVCSTEPTTYTEANSTYKLTSVDVDNTDFSIADGVNSGRRLIVAGQNATITATGTAQHYALLDSANSKLLYVTSCASVSVSINESATINTFDIELSDPR